MKQHESDGITGDLTRQKPLTVGFTNSPMRPEAFMDGQIDVPSARRHPLPRATF